MLTFRFETDAGLGGESLVCVDLPDVRAAQIQAVKYLGELLSKDGPQLWLDDGTCLTVSDNDGLCLFRLDLAVIRSPSLPEGRP